LIAELTASVRIPILLYHSISSEASSSFYPWTVSPGRFDEHVRFLREEGYTPLTVTELVDRLGEVARLPEKPVIVTFDDGFADFAENAVPVLTRYDFSSTLYIVTGYVGGTSSWLRNEGEGDRPMLTWQQINELPAAGVECGAHSHSHLQLDSLRTSDANDQIVWSRRELENRLGRAVDSFSYPHGYHRRVNRSQVQEAGYTSACAVKHAMSSLSDDRFALARIIVASDTTVQRLAEYLDGVGLRRIARRERPATVGWRMYRRARTALTRADVGFEH
jgi:peptidoglycan/xylan/chitin deacetylase (PgdA/CDA1 family)